MENGSVSDGSYGKPSPRNPLPLQGRLEELSTGEGQGWSKAEPLEPMKKPHHRRATREINVRAQGLLRFRMPTALGPKDVESNVRALVRALHFALYPATFHPSLRELKTKIRFPLLGV